MNYSDLAPDQQVRIANLYDRKIHKPCSDPYLRGWGKTECGRLLECIFYTNHGIGIVTCSKCIRVYDGM